MDTQSRVLRVTGRQWIAKQTIAELDESWRGWMTVANNSQSVPGDFLICRRLIRYNDCTRVQHEKKTSRRDGRYVDGFRMKEGPVVSQRKKLASFVTRALNFLFEKKFFERNFCSFEILFSIKCEHKIFLFKIYTQRKRMLFFNILSSNS